MAHSNKFRLITPADCHGARHKAERHTEHSNEGQFEVLEKAQRCRECGERIKAGQTAVRFYFVHDGNLRHWWFWAFIHENQCTPCTRYCYRDCEDTGSSST